MGQLFLFDAVANDTSGDGVTVGLTVFLPPGFAGASVAMRDYVEWSDAAGAGAEITAITSRQPDGSDREVTFDTTIGSFASTGVAFDDALSSVTVGMFAIGAFAQWVVQVIYP